MSGAGFAPLESRDLRDVISQAASNCDQIKSEWSHTIESDQRNKGESNEIQETTCCRPGVARCARPVPAGHGTEHHSIQFLDDDTEPTSRSDAEHHHDYTGTGLSAGPDHSDYRYQHEVQAPQGEAERHDNHHNHAAAPADAEGHLNDDDHNHAPAAIIAGNRS